VNQIKHQIKMSSSSNATRGASSYTYGFPGSQVTINLSRDGNHSLTLSRESNPDTLSSQVRAYRASKSSESSSVPVPAGQRRFPDGHVGPANTPFCKVCYDAGLPVANYTNHFVKDQPGPDGKVVCPTLLAQRCLKCGVAGHTSSYCPGSRRVVVVDPDRSARLREEREQVKKANGGWETVGSDTKSKAKPRIEYASDAVAGNNKSAERGAVPVPVAASRYGSFGVLAVDESSSSEDERQETQETPAAAPAPAPAPARDPTKPLTWAQRAAAAASKPTPSPAPTPAPAQSKLLSDTRFALHALCENIPVSKRAPPRGTPSESSKKRKQESVTVPA
jgi:hypothetical protein